MNRETFPTLGQAALIVLALFLLEYIAMLALYDALGLRGTDDALNAWGIAMVLANGVVFNVLMHIRQMSYRALFHSSSHSARATVALLIGPIALVVPALVLIASSLDAALTSAFPLSSMQEDMFESMLSGGLLMSINVCLVGPVLEEMLFRGIIARSFLAQYPRARAIVGSSAIFGLAHLNIYQFVAGMLIGPLLAWLYERTRSLWPCIVLHVMYNAACMACWGLFGEKHMPFRFASDFPLGTWLGAIALAAPGAFALRTLLAGRASQQP